MDLAAAKDELYAGSPEEFVERRKALAAEARAAKNRALASAIAKLRRPTKSAWLVNLYAREESDEVAALLELAAALQAAQSELDAAELRRLSAERQKSLAAATRRAVALGEARGYAATEAVRQEVTQTLQAALADSDVADDVRAGTVTEAHAYGGFGVFGTATPDVSDAVVATAPTESDGSEREEEESEDERLRAQAEQRLQEAETELSSAADDAEQATEHADELADRVESLRSELAEAEKAEAEARNAARAARKKVTSLEAEVRAAREAYEAV